MGLGVSVATRLCVRVSDELTLGEAAEEPVTEALLVTEAVKDKITVDSATMMNKGLEVIEAHYLFGSNYDDIDIVVHPQSIIHSAVEAADTAVIAQLGWPDMRLPLLYAISWPARVPVPWKPLDLAAVGTMTFKKPDFEKYPCIPLAYAAGRKGGRYICVVL